MDIDTVVAFLNTRDERSFAQHAGKPDEERDELASSAHLRRWLAERELLPANARVSAKDLELALRLRAGLRALLDPAGVRDTEAKRFSRLASELPMRVDFEHGRPVLTPVCPSPVQRVVSEFLVTCVTAAASEEWRRLKMCAAPDCRWVFYDNSRNGMGRWCSMAVCGNRTKTRRYRRSKSRAG